MQGNSHCLACHQAVAVKVSGVRCQVQSLLLQVRWTPGELLPCCKQQSAGRLVTLQTEDRRDLTAASSSVTKIALEV